MSSIFDGIGDIPSLGRAGKDLQYLNATNQRIDNVLENLKGIKGKEGIKEAAQGFESLFILRMLQEMRKTVPKSSLMSESFGMDIFTSMLDEKMANRIATSQKFGLSDMLIDYLENRNEYKIEETNEAEEPKLFKIEKVNSPDSNTKSMTVGDRIEQLLPLINEAAAKYEIDPDLLKAVIVQESRGDSNAVSKSGAKGLMQLMDGTAAELGVKDVFNPRENIFAGAQYLKNQLKEHKGDLKLALASYNAGPGAVKLYNGIPPYAETKNYVQKVVKLQKQFRSGERI